MKPADVAAGPLLVDTDVVSYFHAQRGPAGGPTLADLQALVDGHPLVISFATYGEMLAGGHRAGFGETRMNAIRATLSRYVVLPATAKTSEIWAQLYAKVRGHLAHENGANDVWIAAVARAVPRRSRRGLLRRTIAGSRRRCTSERPRHAAPRRPVGDARARSGATARVVANR